VAGDDLLVVTSIRSIVALIWAAHILCVAPFAAAQEPSFSRAAELQKAGDLTNAAAEYGKFLAAYPENVEARSNLGVVLMHLGKYEEAIAAYQTALATAASNSIIRLNLGIAFYKALRLEDARAAFRQVLSAEPDNMQARYLAADCELRLGRPEAAVTLLQSLEKSRADDPAFAYLLGMAYLGTKQLDKGQLLIDRVLRNGESAEARVMMGVAKRGVGDLKGAVEDLKRAVELNPEVPGVRGMYAQALLESGNPDLARPEFEAELARNPLDFDANLNMGVLFKGEQDYDRALQHLNRALDVRPGDLSTRFQIAGVVLARRDMPKAVAMLEGIVKEAPSFVEAHVALATAYYRLQRKADGDQERAIVERLNRENEAKGRAH
jgi:tetratricopeptide (TPR) repeat protein